MPPILVNKPVEMVHVKILVPRSDADRVVNVLRESGVIHVEELGEKVKDYIDLYDKVVKLMNMINNLLSNVHGLSIDVGVTVQELEAIDIDYIEKDLEKLYSEIESYASKKKMLEEEVRELRDLHSVLADLPNDLVVKNLCFRGKYVSSMVVKGRLDVFNAIVEEFKGVETIYRKIVEQNITAFIILPSTIYDQLVEKLRLQGFNVLDLEKTRYSIDYSKSVGDVVRELTRIIEEKQSSIMELEGKMKSILENSINDLGKYMVILENKADQLKALLGFKNSKYITLIGGWVPKNSLNLLINKLKDSNRAFYIEYREPVKGVDEPPTLLKNPRVVEWYEPIVKFMGVPRYWEWDPTPVIAFSFALFFGIMLGDMGYAVAIILATLLVLNKFVEDPSSRDYVFFKKSLIVSSIVGFIIGFLADSLFGVSFLKLLNIPTLAHVFSNPINFLALALVIGLIHVNISHGLTLVKSIKTRSLGEALSETGLFIAEAFGIPYVLYKVMHIPLQIFPPDAYQYLLYGAFIGVGLIIIGMVKSMGGLGLLMWLFNLTGLLGDVLSYSRLAGVGLATIYLGQSFNQLAMLIYNGLSTTLPHQVAGMIVGGLVAGIILVFGHILNTALSALGCAIHSIRLCFVEFLSKFYEGTGYLFEPLKIVLRRRIVLE